MLLELLHLCRIVAFKDLDDIKMMKVLVEKHKAAEKNTYCYQNPF